MNGTISIKIIGRSKAQNENCIVYEQKQRLVSISLLWYSSLSSYISCLTNEIPSLLLSSVSSTLLYPLSFCLCLFYPLLSSYASQAFHTIVQFITKRRKKNSPNFFGTRTLLPLTIFWESSRK